VVKKRGKKGKKENDWFTKILFLRRKREVLEALGGEGKHLSRRGRPLREKGLSQRQNVFGAREGGKGKCLSNSSKGREKRERGEKSSIQERERRCLLFSKKERGRKKSG